MSAPKKKTEPSSADIRADLVEVIQSLNILQGRRAEITNLVKYGDGKIASYRAEISRLEASIRQVESIRETGPARLDSIDQAIARLLKKKAFLENHNRIRELQSLLREAGMILTTRSLQKVGS